MKLLLDTHALLWSALDPDRLGGAREHLLDERNELFVSAASAWEIAIKSGLGKLSLPEAPGPWFVSRAAAIGAVLQSIEVLDAASVADLPRHHGDPFDRLLIVTARRRGWTLLSRDPAVRRYDVPVFWD